MSDEPIPESVLDAVVDLLTSHAEHPWSQVGSCVWCDACGIRLYHGDLPDEKRTTPKCAVHEWDNGNSMEQCGFYYLCLRCGEKEWTE